MSKSASSAWAEQYYNGSLHSLYWSLREFDVIKDPEYIPGNHEVLAASIEIKRAGAEDFATAETRLLYPDWTYSFYIPFSDWDLTQGTYILRIKYLGGPFVPSDGKIRLSLDSDPVYIKLTVDAEGKISAEEISG